MQDAEVFQNGQKIDETAKKIKLEKLQNKCDFMESKIKTNLEAIS